MRRSLLLLFALLLVLPLAYADRLDTAIQPAPTPDDLQRPAPPPNNPVITEFGPLLEDPVLVMQFNEGPQNHTFGVAWDPDNEYYWTINGGNTSGLLNYYDADGSYVGTTNVAIDGRGIVHNPVDGNLYICSYTGDLYRIDDRFAGTYTMLFDGIMQNGQASMGMSYDGTLLYDFYQGTLEVHDFFTGDLVETITGMQYYGSGNFGGECGIIADTDYLYTWDSSPQELYVYDMDGNYIMTYDFTVGDNGMGLSFTNNMVWINDDSSYDIGTYYAYEVREWIDGPVQFELIPQQTVVPNTGGDVIYGASLTSDLPNTVPGVNYWSMITLPNGQEFGPTLQYTFTHTPFMELTVTNIVQSVPGLAPAGDYTFYGHLGFYPVSLMNDWFGFEKLAPQVDADVELDPAQWTVKRQR